MDIVGLGMRFRRVERAYAVASPARDLEKMGH